MSDHYCTNIATPARTKPYFPVAFLFLLLVLPAIGAAQSYVVENSEGTFEVQVFSTHVEVTDEAGNVSIISTEGDGIVNLETFSAAGGHTVSSTDTSGITVSQEEQDAYDELMAGTTVSSSGDDSGGGGGISPDPIFRESMASEPLGIGDASTQSWACANAAVGLATAGAGVYGACSNPIGAYLCPTALVGYVSASAAFVDACG
ncbi:MAG: hypothetical protein RQ826_17045 [Xanthomonadales bacterium]|nr:hypothetical protein [Xanthomonadales bacterium]